MYWEGYGFAAADTIDVEVRVTGARGDEDGSTMSEGPVPAGSLRWHDEPGSVRATQLTEGTTAVQMRSIVLDISPLAPGPYHLVIAMRSPPTGTVTSVRTFAVLCTGCPATPPEVAAAGNR